MGCIYCAEKLDINKNENKWECEFVKCLQVFPNEINCHSNTADVTSAATAVVLYANEYSCKWLYKTNNFHYSHISFNNYNLLQ